MRRRAFLTSVGGTLLAGCTGSGGETPPVGLSELDELVATEKDCDESASNQGSVRLDGTTAIVEGTIIGESLCAKPSGQVITGSDETAGQTTIVIEASVPGERDCEECHTRIDYEGETTLEEVPDVLTLEHVTRDGGQTEVARVVTVGAAKETTNGKAASNGTERTSE